MKKRNVIVAIVITLVMALIIGVVISEQSKADSCLTDWFYYDGYVEAVHPVNPLSVAQQAAPEDKIPTLFGVDKRVSEAFNSAKAVLREKFGNYTSLNWERFEKTKLAEGSEEYHNGCDAMYSSENNTAYIFQGLKKITDKEMEKVLAHELIHALTVIEEECRTSLYEGLTEYLSVVLYGEDQISYEFPVRFVQLYADKYGIDKAIALFPHDNCLEELDAIIEKQGVMGNIEDLLRYTSFYRDDNASFVILDVMAHFCAKTEGDPQIVQKLVDEMLKGAKKDDLKYFEKVLERR